MLKIKLIHLTIFLTALTLLTGCFQGPENTSKVDISGENLENAYQAEDSIRSTKYAPQKIEFEDTEFQNASSLKDYQENVTTEQSDNSVFNRNTQFPILPTADTATTNQSTGTKSSTVDQTDLTTDNNGSKTTTGNQTPASSPIFIPKTVSET
jgi:hypothetical protein